MKRRIWTYKFIIAVVFLLLAGSCRKDAEEDPTQPTTVSDIDGNIYQVASIGTQKWMAENLKTTRYRNGDPIPNVTNGLQWSGLSSGAYCNLYNDTSYSTTYGRLYNWYTVTDSRKIAPVGWHVPTNEDWQLLINYLGGESVAGGKLKETGTAHWLSPNTGATNEVAFSALSGGQRIINDEHPFVGFGSDGAWWSIEESEPTVAWGINIRSYETDARLMNFPVNYGFAVRCIKD